MGKVRLYRSYFFIKCVFIVIYWEEYGRRPIGSVSVYSCVCVRIFWLWFRLVLLQTLALIQQSEEEDKEGVQKSPERGEECHTDRGRREGTLDSERTVFILFITNDSSPTFKEHPAPHTITHIQLHTHTHAFLGHFIYIYRKKAHLFFFSVHHFAL